MLLQLAERQIGDYCSVVAVLLQCCCSIVAVLLQCCAVLLQCSCSVVAVLLQCCCCVLNSENAYAASDGAEGIELLQCVAVLLHIRNLCGMAHSCV